MSEKIRFHKFLNLRKRLSVGPLYNIFFMIAGLTLVSCSHSRVYQGSDEATRLDSERVALRRIQIGNPSGNPSAGTEIDSTYSVPSARSVDYGEIVIGGVKLKNTQFDFPVTINSRVEFWVDYFTGRGREAFTKYLVRSEFFIPFIRPILSENNMPEDLVFLAMIESGFHNHARSRAKAVGPWQFITPTGRRYGLQIDWWVDHRRDTQKSTLAAIAYLKDLYQMFGSWELASAAYNAGETKVKRGMQRYATADFWALARHQFLRPETRDYVPKIIAAALIAKNRGQFGFPVGGEKLNPNEALAPDGQVVRVEKEGEELPIPYANSGMNPREELAREESDISPNDVEGLEDILSLPVAVADTNVRAVPTPQVHKDGSVSGTSLVEFEVPSPADLFQVAHAAGISYQTVKALNPEILRWVTPPTKKTYRIKLPATSKEQFLSTYNGPTYDRTVRFLAYRARSGDSVGGIARRFGFQPDPIEHLNGIKRSTPIRQGRVLILPLPADRSRDIAVSDTKDPVERRKVRRKYKKNSSYRVTAKKRVTARARARKISLAPGRS